MIEMTSNETKWLRLKWSRIRKSQQMADAANSQWNRLNDELKEYMDRKGETDVVQRVKIKSQSIALKDAFDVGKWHSSEAQRHIDDVMLFLKLKEMGLEGLVL